jgi:hypothetical protein
MTTHSSSPLRTSQLLKPTAARQLYQRMAWTTIATEAPARPPDWPPLVEWIARPCPVCALTGTVHGHPASDFPSRSPQPEETA